MKKSLLSGISGAALALFCLASAPDAALGAGRAQSGNILFGDFNVDDSKVQGLKPETFYVLLYTTDGNVFARQAVSSHSRYKFLSVPNGEYYLVVEVEGQEVARIFFIMKELRPTDVRRDLNLEWNEGLMPKRATPASTVAAEDYKRTDANRAKFTRALEEERKKGYEAAAALLGEIVADDPKDFMAWTELGTLQFKKGHLDEAARAYLRALESRPNFALALLNLGKLQMAQKEYDGAIEFLGRAVRAQPQSADINYLLGESYLQVKKGSKAVIYLNEAIRLDPQGKADVHLRLAALYNAAGTKDRAAAEYEKFLEKRPDYPDKKRLQKYISEYKRP